MSKLKGDDTQDRQRIVALVSQRVAGRIESGEIKCTDEAIKGATLQAFDDAKTTINAVNEYLCG